MLNIFQINLIDVLPLACIFDTNYHTALLLRTRRTVGDFRARRAMAWATAHRKGKGKGKGKAASSASDGVGGPARAAKGSDVTGVAMECLTLNNLGCCMRRRGKMQDALQFLLQACALEPKEAGAMGASAGADADTRGGAGSALGEEVAEGKKAEGDGSGMTKRQQGAQAHGARSDADMSELSAMLGAAHSNTCAVLSELRRHEEALEH